MNEPLATKISSAISDCMSRSTYLRGPETKSFEEEWAEFCGQKYAVTCNSGTDALEIATNALGLKNVYLQANTLPLSGIGIARGGAKIQISEVDSDGHITSDKENSVPVLLFGRNPKSNLALLYDAAHAHGWQPPINSCAAWSFYPTKTLGALGDAGAITTNDENLAQTMIELCGRDDELRNSRQTTSRIDEIQAAILRIKLKNLPDWLNQRQIIADQYNSRLSQLGITLTGKSHNHIYAIRVKQRDLLRRALSNAGIETKIHWSRSLNKVAGPWNTSGNFLNAESWASEILSLPMYPGLTEVQVDFICDSIEDFMILKK